MTNQINVSTLQRKVTFALDVTIFIFLCVNHDTKEALYMHTRI